MALSDRLREARGGMSQKAAALACGIKQPAWNTYEKGISIPGGESIIKICRELKVSADWLLGLDETHTHSVVASAPGAIAASHSNVIVGGAPIAARSAAASCSKCPYKAAVKRLQKVGMTFPGLDHA